MRSPMTPTYFIFLYGPPGSGKTAPGLRLAEQLASAFLSTWMT